MPWSAARRVCTQTSSKRLRVHRSDIRDILRHDGWFIESEQHAIAAVRFRKRWHGNRQQCAQLPRKLISRLRKTRVVAHRAAEIATETAEHQHGTARCEMFEVNFDWTFVDREHLCVEIVHDFAVLVRTYATAPHLAFTKLAVVRTNCAGSLHV